MAGRIDEKSRPDGPWRVAWMVTPRRSKLISVDPCAELYLHPFLAARIFKQQRIEASRQTWKPFLDLSGL
jgi:hypothetical protein